MTFIDTQSIRCESLEGELHRILLYQPKVFGYIRTCPLLTFRLAVKRETYRAASGLEGGRVKPDKSSLICYINREYIKALDTLSPVAETDR